MAKKTSKPQPASPTSDSNSSASESSSSSPMYPSQEPTTNPASVSSSSASGSASERASEPPSESANQSTGTEKPPADFDSWYLRQLTAEFGDDLDKVRNANDFTDASLPVLIQALKECSAVFTEEQKRKIMGKGE